MRVLSWFVFCIFLALSCQHAPYIVPIENRTGDPTLCFERDILPIFLSECAKSGCHDAAGSADGYRLDSYENIVSRGIAPGNAYGSKIYKSVTGLTEEKMPQGAAALSTEKTELLKRWINAGALKDSNCTAPCDSNNFSYRLAIQPIVAKYCIVCHSPNNPSGDLMLNSYDAVKSAVQNRNLVKSINYAPGYKAMPQGLKMSDCEIRQVEKWVTANMPDN